MFVLRLAHASDVPALRDVFQRSSWSNVDDRPLLEAHPEFLVWSGEPALEGRTILAESDGRIVGFVSTINRGDADEVEDLFVDPDWMRQGIAAALIERIGGRPLVVDANRNALSFYESAGFVADGEVPLDHGTAMRMHRHPS